MRNILTSLGCLCLLAGVGCGDDDDPIVNLDAGDGSTTFDVTVRNISTAPDFPASGVFNTPTGAAAAGPAMPGSAYSFSFRAAVGYPARMDTTRLSFATMLVNSNDMFFAPDEDGIPLYDGSGNPIDGADVTAMVAIWDAGTEVNDGLAANLPPNTGGTDEGGTVTEDSGDASNYIEVTVDSMEVDREIEFTVTITNVSDDNSVDTPLSPGVWVVHNAADGATVGPLFTTGSAASDGLEDIAEDGNPMVLGDALSAQTGVLVVSTPGVWAVHSAGNPLFTSGSPASVAGLESLAEDGDGSTLATTLMADTNVASSAQFGTGPIPPGGMATFTVTASPGDRLSFATMVLPTNDYIFTFPGNGVELFTGNAPRSGTLPGLDIWDVGTEVNQGLGVGLDQPPVLQSAPNTGAADPDSNVRLAGDATLPAASTLLEVSVTPAS